MACISFWVRFAMKNYFSLNLNRHLQSYSPSATESGWHRAVICNNNTGSSRLK